MHTLPETAIRLLIVDDHFFTRMGLASSIQLEPDMRVVGEAACGREALDLYHQHAPDVTVLDGLLPDMHGAEVAREIVKSNTGARLMIFSVDETEEDIHRAVAAGVSGYLPKTTPRAEFIGAIRDLAAGRRYFPTAIQEKLRERKCHVGLSQREVEVLKCMAKGLPNKIIAADLGVSAETVKTFVARIMEKLNVEDRTQAVVEAMSRGWLRPSQPTRPPNGGH
jgi:DNA-binding NarL/FixJ family response regulator